VFRPPLKGLVGRFAGEELHHKGAVSGQLGL